QAEDGIRDWSVTGVQTCALPIWACDIDMTGNVWLYRPAFHKTSHHGHGRAIAIGPKGQEIVRRRLRTDTQAYLFSPRESVAEVRSEERRVGKEGRARGGRRQEVE